MKNVRNWHAIIVTKRKKEEERMKVMKKIATFILSVCLIVPCFGMLTYAADGQIVFSDPSTKGGETVEVTGVVRAGAAIGDADLNLTYNTEYLKFKSGDNVTESGSGQLVYSGKGTGSETELRFNMQFDVLKEGTAKIEVSSYKAWLYSDETLNCTEGSSAVTIAAGDGTTPTDTTEGSTTDVKVTVNGTEYTLSESFSEAEIPLGFAEATMEYEGAQRKVVKQQTADVYLAYLVDADNNGKFFLYDNDTSTFVPFEQINISDTAAIMLLSERGDIKLPKEYQETEITLNDQTFPAWRNAEESDYYILYAMNNQGEKSLYQYDSVDGTYQRFDAPTVETEEKADSFLGKFISSIENYLNYVILGAAVLFVILIVILIVLAVKLHNRNAELDELYDEYGIDLEDDEDIEMIETDEESENETANQEATAEDADPEETYLEEEQVAEADIQEKDTFADEDEFEDDFVGEDDFGDDFDDDDFDDDFGDDFDDDDFDDDDFGDDNFSDTDFGADRLNDERTAPAKEKKQSYEDFDLDFIDLDD